MIRFNDVSREEFLQKYWQKKPLLLKKALPNFKSILDENELAGLALEESLESRLVIESPESSPVWQLKKGPFSEEELSALPKKHWSLLIQGVDRVIPEVSHLLNHFDFLPQWRVDDVMISLAGLQGSVGPHYDHYDVFLLQAKGQRRWQLTTQDCVEENYLENTELRIMKNFEVQQEYVLEKGDILYIPPYVGHHGRALTNHSISYSFGYRSYRASELWDSYADFISNESQANRLYKDPNWNELSTTSEIPQSAVKQAKELMLSLLNDEDKLQRWFSSFATELDQGANELLTPPLSEQESKSPEAFIEALKHSNSLERDLCARVAYHYDALNKLHLFINGEAFELGRASEHLVKLVANKRIITLTELTPFMNKVENQTFLYQLWQQQFLQFPD